MASLHANDMEMPPPNNKSGAVNLTPEQIATLKQWIDQGAKSSKPRRTCGRAAGLSRPACRSDLLWR
jgi:hypothetical protein